MGLRPTKKDEGARDWCRGINNLDRAFNGAGTPPRARSWESPIVGNPEMFFDNRISIRCPATARLPKLYSISGRRGLAGLSQNRACFLRSAALSALIGVHQRPVLYLRGGTGLLRKPLFDIRLFIEHDPLTRWP